MTFAFIAAEKADDPSMSIAWACRTLAVSTSGYYDWVRAQAAPCRRRRADAELRLGMGIHVGRKRVERLMRAEGIEGVTRRRRRGLTKRDADTVPNDDLVARRFSPDGPTSCGSPTSPSTPLATARSAQRW